MTKRWLSRWVSATIGVYLIAIVVGIALKILYPDKDDPIYNTFKDLIPFFIVIPAAWLGYCFSRRLAYLQHLRMLWGQLNSAVQCCFKYTHLELPTQEQYGDTLTAMNAVIDEVRGAFKNIGERSGTRGLYPFEEIKSIQKIISDLGFGDKYDAPTAAERRKKIVKYWKRVQEPFLSEFDREEPIYPSSPYISKIKEKIMSEEKLFGKFNELILILIGFFLTGVVGTYIAQTYTTKNAELSAANLVFSEYSKRAGDRYFTMNQVMLAHSKGENETVLKNRWNDYKSEVQKWNTSRGYNKEMIRLYFGQSLWNQERNIHYFFYAWGETLQKVRNNERAADYVCLKAKRDDFLKMMYSFNYALGEAIQKGNIGSNRSNVQVAKNNKPKPPCLIPKQL